jgi:hypothetical protein
MEVSMKAFWNTLVFLIVLIVFAAINLVVHELGHCYTINAVGGKCGGVYVTPGVRIWPLKEFGQHYPNTWKNFIGLTIYDQAAPTDQASGFVALMGSGSVAALSLLALFVLNIFFPRGWVRFPLLAQSLMFFDLLLYTILPHWFGLPHFFFIGGTSPEPLEGAIKMGIPESMFIWGVLIFSGLMLAGCLGYLVQSAKRRE